jgi:hypothetical protein
VCDGQGTTTSIPARDRDCDNDFDDDVDNDDDDKENGDDDDDDDDDAAAYLSRVDKAEEVDHPGGDLGLVRQRLREDSLPRVVLPTMADPTNPDNQRATWGYWVYKTAAGGGLAPPDRLVRPDKPR